MKKTFLLMMSGLVVMCLLISCENETETPDDDPGNNESILIFKCKIDGVDFAATSVVTQGTYGMISAKGLKASNGETPSSGNIRMTISFGCNASGEYGLGNHEMVGTRFETANSPNNKNKAIFTDVVINGLEAYVQKEGTVNVESYYETTYWQGAKGTFNNIKFYTYTPAPEYALDSLVLTNGEFEVKYVIPGF
jgi:hypothetical protein